MAFERSVETLLRMLLARFGHHRQRVPVRIFKRCADRSTQGP
jgi:hypothetical protein